MMANWSTRRIEEVCEVTSSKRIYATELVAEGVPFLKSKIGHMTFEIKSSFVLGRGLRFVYTVSFQAIFTE